jgi:hypothetical protein
MLADQHYQHLNVIMQECLHKCRHANKLLALPVSEDKPTCTACWVLLVPAGGGSCARILSMQTSAALL